MAFLGGIFGGGADPMSAANKYLEQIPDIQRQYLEPFINRAGSAGDIMSEQFGRMAQDPTAMLNQLMEGYEPSKGYQFQQDQMSQAAANTAAAGGLRGSPQEQAQQQSITQGLLSQDMQNWLKNAMGLQSEGLQGESGLYRGGLGAAGNLADSLSNVLGTQAQMGYRDALQRNQGPMDIFRGLLGGLGTLGGFSMPKGADGSGGGSVAGNWLSKLL